MPAELRRDPALAQEYRSQLAQLAAAPEQKAHEAYATALAKARELGVENACVKATAAVLARRAAEPGAGAEAGAEAEAALEKLPPLAPPATAGARAAAHGLLAQLYVAPPPQPAGQAELEAELVPLGPARVAQAGSSLPPDLAELEARPAAPPPRRADPVAVPSEKDEDLLP